MEIGTICRDGGVDISGSGLDYVSQIRITNAPTTTTLDGYDVDGVIAIYNCEGIMKPTGVRILGDKPISSELICYPNPSKGDSKIAFTIAQSSRVTLEVFDMRGQKVATLFDKEAHTGQEYTLRFDGTNLPNGVYICRLVTASDVLTEKVLISK